MKKTDNEITYIVCKSCIGKIIEGTELLSPCIRAKPEGFEFPNSCPKKARGVIIDSTPIWENISEEQFNEYWEIGKSFNAKRRIY